MKGAAGRRVYGLDSSEVTVAGVAPRVSTSSRAEASVSTVALFERGLRVPSSAKSLPVATRAPSTVAILAVNCSASGPKVPVTSQ